MFLVHDVDEHDKAKMKRTLSRSEMLDVFGKLAPCLVGIEAYGGAHYWARELKPMGHDARLMASKFVPVVERGVRNARLPADFFNRRPQFRLRGRIGNPLFCEFASFHGMAPFL